MNVTYEQGLEMSRTHWYTDSRAKVWSVSEARAELAYIQGVNPINPGASFNYDPDCFANYCRMQETQAIHSGFPLIAIDIEQCRLIAERR